MTIRKRKVTTFEWSCTCERCGHKWKTTGPKPPQACARCKARGWDKPARPYRRRQK
ncbi:MAG: hypothetical protein HY317_03165 [Acidobacteria bacterium]|nr:hypothetical protein [Acidobacteriota bacterium]